MALFERRTVNQQFTNDSKDKFNDLSIDWITWKSIILSSLGKLYGLIGEASHFDILQLQETRPAMKLIIRIQHEDKDKFISSLMAFTFKLSKFIGGDYDVNCYIRVNKNNDHLGLVLDKSFR
ncbi:unnamed protein product [Debaryomyces fabryi]|nr:unnamed protein product [Debaryomyces fabryi]